MNSKKKGDILENITEYLCKGIKGAKVTKKAKLLGKKSNTLREIDVLIEGKVGYFDIMIAIEAKNYGRPIGAEKVESLKSKLSDIGANLGVMVCTLGFTEPAKTLAKADDIQLFEVFDTALGNSNLFIPLRFIEPQIENFAYRLKHRTAGHFYHTTDVSRWRFHVGEKIYNAKQMALIAWNNNMIPHTKGSHVANFNAVTMSDSQTPNKVQYCELEIEIGVSEKYYLKLYPACFLKNLETNGESFRLKADLYTDPNGWEKNGWKKFQTLESMNLAAEIENQPLNVRDLIIRPGVVFTIEGVDSSDLI